MNSESASEFTKYIRDIGNSSYANSSYRDYICMMYMENPPSSSFSSTYRELRVIGIRLIGIRLYLSSGKHRVDSVKVAGFPPEGSKSNIYLGQSTVLE